MPGIFPTLSTGSAYCYPVRRKTNTRTTTHVFCDLTELRYKKGVPTTDFVFEYRSIKEADKEKLRAFYALQRGEAATDWVLLFEDTLYLNCQFVGPFQSTNITTTLWTVTLHVRTTGTSIGVGVPTTIPTPTSTLPPGTTAAVYLSTAHQTTPAPTLYQYATLQMSSDGGAFYGSGGNIFAGWGNGVDDWSKRINTITGGFAYSPGALRIVIGLTTISGFIVNGIGTLDVYDAYLIATLPDGSTELVRPTAVASDGSGGDAFQGIQDIGNAVDGDDATFARIYSDNRAISGHYGQPPGLVFIW